MNNYFNKCICYDFFHNSIRNKIRFILREISNNNPETNPNNRNTNNNNQETEANPTIKIHKASSFPRDKHIEVKDLSNSNTNRFATSNPKLKEKESSNNSAKKNYGKNYYLETHEDKLDKNSDFVKKFEVTKHRSKLKENLKSARKDRIINLYTEANTNTKSKENLNNLSLKRSNSQKSEKVNKENINNYFISEKIFKSKLNFDLENIKVKDFDFNNKISKKQVKSTENSKGFNNYTSNGDTGNYFNRKSSVNTNSIGRLNTNDTNKILSNNSNGMSELHKFNSNPGKNPTQIILNAENNCNSPDENNENTDCIKNSVDKVINKLNFNNHKVSSNSENKRNNNNISNNPNISIFNNFIFSLNKKKGSSNAKSSSSNLFNISKNITNANNNTELNENKLQSPININNNNNNYQSNKDSNENTNSKFNQISSPKEFNSSDNYFSNHITKTEGNSNNNINLQNFNSNGSSHRFETQVNLASHAFNDNKNFRNKQQDTEPIKVLHSQNNHKNQKSIKSSNFDFPKQYFSIGYIFIVLACKSIKLKVFEYLDNFTSENFEQVKNFNLKKCCLFHCLISLEDGLQIKKKFSIETFFSFYSENFKNFICNVTTISLSNRHKTKKRCLNGNTIYSLNAKSMQEHPWLQIESNFSNRLLSSNTSNLKITMKEVIKNVRESFKTSLVEFNEKKYDNVLNKLEVILTNHKDVLKEENIRNALATKQKIIKKLSRDIGINYQDFFERLCALVNKIFANKE